MTTKKPQKFSCEWYPLATTRELQTALLRCEIAEWGGNYTKKIRAIRTQQLRHELSKRGAAESLPSFLERISQKDSTK